MKRSLNEIGTGGIYDEPKPPGNNPWSDRMKWKSPGSPSPDRMQWQPPGQGNPRLHPDEQAALAGNDIPQAADEFIDSPEDLPVTASPEPAQQIPIGQKPPSRFNWSPTGTPTEEPGLGAPNLGQPVGRADLDRVTQELRAEEALPPHQQNAAKIARLKAELGGAMSESWVQRAANRLLPRLET